MIGKTITAHNQNAFNMCLTEALLFSLHLLDMPLESETIFKKINDLYNKKGFLDKYGADIWLAVIICLVFFCITAYYYVLNNIEPIKADWENQKCSPAVLPFAGLINKGPNDTTLDFTNKNFTGCVQTVLTNITGTAFQPVYYVMKTLTDDFSNMLNSVNSVRSIFDRVRTTIHDFSTETMSRTLNITMPLVQMFIGIKSMMGKMTGVLTASLFTLYGSYLTFKSLFLFIIELLTIILIALVAIIVVFLIISFIPLFGSWAIPVAAVNIAIMIAILIPTLFVQIFMSNVLSLSTRSLPGVPSCFAGETMINVRPSGAKPIRLIDVGDVLKNGEIVTAVMQFSACEQHVYNLYGVCVTGEHRVLHKTLGWLKVKQHPESVLLPNFSETFVYCLGTTTKTFMIGEQVYSDWDDIDKHVIKCLQDNCPDYKNIIQIHKYLDNGLISDSLVELHNGDLLPIKNIQVNDCLANGEQVLGVIKIDAMDIKNLYEYKVNDNTIYGCNINPCLAENINVTIKKVEKHTFIIKKGEKYLYQLLTDTGKFTVNGLTVRDYNYGIDQYL
jgi:hypothetical protein